LLFVHGPHSAAPPSLQRRAGFDIENLPITIFSPRTPILRTNIPRIFDLKPIITTHLNLKDSVDIEQIARLQNCHVVSANAWYELTLNMHIDLTCNVQRCKMERRKMS
jgi:hypothetical protein